MTQTTKTVFEQYQVRKSKKQKQAFRTFVQSIAEENGYTYNIENAIFGSKNIIIGNPDTAKVVYTAHYDTCAVLPFPNFITPKHFGIYLLYQFFILTIFLLCSFLLSFVCAFLLTLAGVDATYIFLILYLLYFGFLSLMLFGPANKHTANDNTSGVTTLLDIMTTLPEDARHTTAFIFFDNEELGLLGSSSFASKHKKTMKNKLLVNFDCVSDGSFLLFAVRKKGAHYISYLQQAFPSKDNFTVEILTKGVFYPSDQINFPCGVGVAALKTSKKFGIAYMDRIHTKRDTVYEEENIAYLTNGAVTLALLLKNQKLS